MREARSTLELIDNGIKGAVGVLRRAKVAQASVGFARKILHERSSEPRFADTWLARD